MSSTLLLVLSLGLRHGTDPDHLTAIDGLSRIRPRSTNGIYFALGHGLVVTLLAVGVGRVLAGRVEFLGPWVLVLIGIINLWRVMVPSRKPAAVSRPVIAQPFLLGMLLAASVETASQFGALILAGRMNPWLVGSVFTVGMVLVDGLDGVLAASTQKQAAMGQRLAKRASRTLGLLVAVCAFVLGGAEILNFDIDRMALPIGLGLFAAVIAIRVWSRTGRAPVQLAPVYVFADKT
jgi:high-affinity nickel-transport protein